MIFGLNFSKHIPTALKGGVVGENDKEAFMVLINSTDEKAAEIQNLIQGTVVEISGFKPTVTEESVVKKYKVCLFVCPATAIHLDS